MKPLFQIFYGEKATSLEITACHDLSDDIHLVLDFRVEILQLAPNSTQTLKKIESADSIQIIVGSPSTNTYLKHLIEKQLLKLTPEYPGKRGGIVQIVNDPALGQDHQLIILGGSDPQGTQYAVYDFSHNELGIDPFRYWTGYMPRKIDNFSFSLVKDRVIEPPLVPIMGYFDNDNDELANLTKPYLEFSMEQWQEIIKSLVRLKYNAIDIHDHLGRAEFYRWPHYKALRPNYEPNTQLLEQIIEYAHERGVMIQVSFYLGWKFKVISDKASLNWAKYKHEWLDVWRYYLKETPIGKCDIFLNRPRDQRWDRKYKGKGKGNDPVSVFNEAFPAMLGVIKEHNPYAIVIVDLYSEGRGVYKNGFRPQPKDQYIMAWPDNGFGAFEYMPEDLDNYKWGIYMHAGFFLNHVVHDPYPEVLAKAMKPALENLHMNAYCLVNGQTFRHYLLNMEACSELCQNPSEFNPQEFYSRWIARYFGQDAIDSTMKVFQLLHLVQEPRWGYIFLMTHLIFAALKIKIMKYLPFLPLKFLNFIYERVGKLGPSFDRLLEKNVPMIEQAMVICEQNRPKVQDQAEFYFDYVELPVRLMMQLYQIAALLQSAGKTRKNKTLLEQAKSMILEHHQTRLKGDKNPKWNGWYDPLIRRPNGGYFDIERLKSKGDIVINRIR
jgi:hypothetical protein